MPKKRIKKWLAVPVVCFIFMGCSANETSHQHAKDNQKNTIRIMAPLLSPESPGENSPSLKALEAYTKKDIKVTWVPNSSYNDKFNIVMASGDMPHAIVVTDKSPGFIKSVKAGAFWELSKYVKDYKNLSRADEKVMKNSSVNGEVYGIYRARDLIRASIIIRTDWLTNVGLDMPKTIEDFYEVLKAFKEKDPDKNGKDDTYGMVVPKWMGLGNGSPWDIMQTWFGAPNRYGVNENGELVPDFTTDEYMEALRFFKKLYDERLINQDFAVMDSAKWNDPIVKGKAGVIVDTGSRASQIQSALEEADPKNKNVIDVVGTVKGPKGTYTFPTSGYAGMIAIPKASVKTEKELKDVLAFLDKMNDEQAQIIANNGVEGRNYKLENGTFTSLEKNNKKLLYEHEGLAQFSMGIPEQRYYIAEQKTRLFKHRQQVVKEGEKIAVFNPAESLVSDLYTQKGAQLDNIILDAKTQFIIGDIDEKGFQDAVELWYKSGGEELMKELNELYLQSK
ncbi:MULTISPECIES: extracellular solute-binding protein [Bacillus]|uniref:Lipoprotein LipO n=1 Tax=Bacillus sonorensis TaxID=119858 RepID=A0ABM6LKT9_9BACI|nr:MULTISPECIES: extracellular solute-binding protein [Bacillus]TWK73020.1 Lipoprotein LipO [Bacillus paralicheniformis]ASB89974.1 Lipoprotein LipO [Bacillus sonorensis]MBG9916809.1 lipoprotein [Bacillus sonorensis]MCF7619224.1 extracellular solute-binding protein [Bacillus sonorensis]MCY7855587.1 extracellular solute-binding protein [Bacillus sonorensis]